MKTRILIACRLALATLVITGVVYPLAVTLLARLAFPSASTGSIVYHDGEAVGSELIGQAFASTEYFHSRPSASDYDTSSSGPSNLGPTSAELQGVVTERVRQVRERESLDPDASVPADLVCASASGLDPHISPASARLQAGRIARARELPVDDVLDLVDAHTERATLGFMGQDRVNVLLLNVALDETAEGLEPRP